METEPIKRSHSAHRKRRERAHQLQLEKLKSDDESAEDEKDPNSAGKDRGRTRPRKKRSGAGTYEEDIIDGFAIVSFKTVEDLEKYAAGKLSSKKNLSLRQNNSLSSGHHNIKKNDKKTPTNLPKVKKPVNSLVNSEDSGETTDNLDTSDLILNGPSRIINRRCSDVSTRSSSGAGYMCDSESGDEHISDASTDTFSSTPINRSFNRDVIPGCVQITPPFTAVTPPVTTVCMVTTTTSDITVTTVTTTTSCDSLATTTNTTPVITTTVTPAVVNSNQHSYLGNSCHSHIANHNNNHLQSQTGDSHHKSDNFPASGLKSDNYPPSNHKIENYPAISQKSDNYPAVSHKSDYPAVSHKSDNYPAVIHKSDSYPVISHKSDSFIPNHQKSDNYQNSQHQSDKFSSGHYQSDNYSISHHQHRSNHHHHHHTQVSREPSQTVQKPHSDVIRNHENSKSSSPSLKRVHPTSIPPTPPLTKSQPGPPKTQSLSSVSLPSNSVIKDSKRTPPLSRTPRREETRERERERESHQVLPPSLSVSKSFLGIQGHHGATTPILYSPLGPSPGLPLPLHSTSNHSTFPASISPLHPLPSSAPHTPHNMFAPPMPLGPPAGPLGGATPAPPPPPQAIPDPDMLREELNRRFLQSTQDRNLVQSMPGYLRADFHQHMHQHQHQHTHNHTYHTGLAPPPGASPIVPPPAAHLYDYRPGLPHRPRGQIAEPDPRHIANGKDKPVHPQHPASAMPGLPGYPSLLLNPATAQGAGPLSSGLSGAFQPKNVSGLHPAHLLMPLRDRDKSGIPPSPQPAPAGSKKPGKWCAAHVRIAWEIYHHQQKGSDKGPTESKLPDPLRPPNHLLPGGMLPRSQDYPTSNSMSVLASGRSLFDTSPHSLLGPGGVPPLAAPAFPRPSPYSIGTSLNLGSIGNGLVATSREPAIPISSGSHEWNRLHRTPPTFPTPPAWPKPEERDRDKDYDRERSIERRREEERERERRLSVDDRHRFPSIDERSRERFRENDILIKSRSRSRSRSPVRNGRVDSAKPSDRRYDDNPLLKIKEERRENNDLLSERDRLLKSEMTERDHLLKNEFLRTADPFIQASVLDRTRMLGPSLLAGDRLANPASLWNPFDKGAIDSQNHRLGVQREMEQSRNPLVSRLPHPQTMAGMAVFEQERIKEELIMREERARREYIEGLPLFERERLFYENSKIPTLRPPDHLAGLAHHFPRTLSPALGHPSLIKRSSPAVIPGAPPPLIHSVCGPPNRVHNSVALNKTKGVSPIDSVGESKCDSNSNSTDPDAHSR